MGFMKPSVPDVDPETWRATDWATRIQVCSRHWAEEGFGTPSGVYLIYLLKIAGYAAGAAAVIAATPGLGGLGQIADISNDSVGQALASAELPKRVHLKRSTGSSNDG